MFANAPFIRIFFNDRSRKYLNGQNLLKVTSPEAKWELIYYINNLNYDMLIRFLTQNKDENLNSHFIKALTDIKDKEFKATAETPFRT